MPKGIAHTKMKISIQDASAGEQVMLNISNSVPIRKLIYIWDGLRMYHFGVNYSFMFYGQLKHISKLQHKYDNELLCLQS